MKRLIKKNIHDIENRDLAFVYLDGKIEVGKNHPEIVDKMINLSSEKNRNAIIEYMKLKGINQQIINSFLESMRLNDEFPDEYIQEIPMEVWTGISKYDGNGSRAFDKIPLAFGHIVKKDKALYLETNSLFNVTLNEVINELQKHYPEYEIYDDDSYKNKGGNPENYIKLSKKLIKKSEWDAMKWLITQPKNPPIEQLTEEQIQKIESIIGQPLTRSGYEYEFDKKNGNGLIPMNNKVKQKHIPNGKIYRAIDSNEYDFIIKSGYIKSNSSKNFDTQQGATFFSSDINNVYGYYKDCLRQTGNAYIIEVSNIENIELYMNIQKEIYTFENIDKKHISSIYQLDKNSDLIEL